MLARHHSSAERYDDDDDDFYWMMTQKKIIVLFPAVSSNHVLCLCGPGKCESLRRIVVITTIYSTVLTEMSDSVL
jgi:hypothetical protein